MATELSIKEAIIGFRNFRGAEGQYNREGERSFVVFLSVEDAKKLQSEGWNIKWPKPRPELDPEDDRRQPYLPIEVTVDGRFRSKMFMINERNESDKTVVELKDPEAISELDYLDFEKVGLKIRPYHWSVSGKSGVKAYLSEGYFVLKKNDLAEEYGV